MTTDECKKLIVRLGMKYSVPPKLIAERLLSKDDKDDMLAGLITAETLDSYVVVWKTSGMCHYANGTGEFYSGFKAYAGVGWGSPAKMAP